MKLSVIEIGGTDAILVRFSGCLVADAAIWSAAKACASLERTDYTVHRHIIGNCTSLIFSNPVDAIKKILKSDEQFSEMSDERFEYHKFTIYKEAMNRFLKAVRDYINERYEPVGEKKLLSTNCHALYLRDKGWRYLIDEFTGRFMVTPLNDESLEYIGHFIDSLDNLERAHYKYPQENPSP